MKYQITIPKPCHEDWSKMTQTEKGKFCKSCNKEVIDFTNLSTSEISKKVLKEQNLCGRFKESQLNTEIEIIKKNNFSKIAAGVALVSAITVTEPLFSQTKKDSIENVNQIQGKFIKVNDSIEKFINIKGVIKDNSGTLPGVSVFLKGTSIRTETDFDGNFSIKIPNEKGKSTILVISYLGYHSQEIDILKIKKPLVIEMKEDENVLEEIIIIAGQISVNKEKNLLKPLRNLFKKKENRN
ncbi:MAG: carboxypeptidase-like regulatory domain-containing protein [Polaribacter sp.]|uniref:carboxypeptidase-like regulatory domain-containing protein n=1 Tax=Polaribacter sp. TaxID=1920175 RepID=UPI003BAFA178